MLGIGRSSPLEIWQMLRDTIDFLKYMTPAFALVAIIAATILLVGPWIVKLGVAYGSWVVSL